MTKMMMTAIAGATLMVVAGAAQAANAPAPLQVPNPNYVSIVMTVDVNAPAERAWARVGKFCDIGEWLGVGGGCTILSGDPTQVGAVRSIGNEIQVARGANYYTYTQPVRATGNYNMYHGTVESVPVTATTSKFNYTLVWDASADADAAAVEADKTSRRTTFTRALNNMKILAEGGTLPPPAARGGPPAAGAAPAAPPAGR
ncbi:MAG: Polyketide cyclase / dehydrase and lipid transport [Caulobacteraceae bacterium]|nr:Polyketide cyclase / dehydrase and lipid transport [Caulobacteraceae bacterium]